MEKEISAIKKDPEMETELTNKFLRGEISFADYSTEWYVENTNEDVLDSDDDQNSVAGNKTATDRNLKVRRKKYTRLSTALLGLMGEANLRFVKGDVDIAEKMCHEIIRQVPSASEPYQTLSNIYEHNPEKSLQFALLAAHLSPSDADEWLRLANISEQRKDIRQQMLCMTQAIKARPTSFELHQKRLDILKSLEDAEYPLHSLKISRVKCYEKIVTSLPSSEGPTILEYAMKAATIYHATKEIEKALDVMMAAYKKCAALFEVNHINMYLELLLSQGQHQSCLEVFVANIGVEIEAEVQTLSANGVIEEHTDYVNCVIPNSMPIDLKSKLLVCLIHLGATGLVSSLLEDFLTNDVDKAADLFMDIEEALSTVGEHKMALRVLEPLLKNENFDLAAVWLKHAECLYKLGIEDESIKSYYNVLKLAPQHIHARKRLFDILNKNGSIDEALLVLQQNHKLVVSAKLLHEQCVALKKHNHMEKYMEVGEALLSKTFVRLRHQSEIKIARMVRAGIDLIHNFRTIRGENIFSPDDLHFDQEENFKLSENDEWNLYLELLRLAHENKKYYIMQRLSLGALMSKNLNSHKQDIEFYCLQACLLNNDLKIAYQFIKDFLVKNMDMIPIWNLLNLVAYEGANIGKSLMRLFQKEDNVTKYILNGNCNIIAGRYLAALNNFLKYHEINNDALSPLLISISLLVMATQRTVDKHQNLVLQGVSYLLTYQHLRKWDHESYYNCGRAFQMLNINNLAIEYYERALACQPGIKCEFHKVDLTKEIAFNLHVLHRDHAPHIAKMYLEKYIVI